MADQAWRVLIVDDEPPIRAELNYLLKQDGRVGRIEEAGGATEAVEKILAFGPEVLFIDIQMPGTSGVQLADTLQKLKKPPVIVFVTAFSEYAAEAFELDAADYVLKPVPYFAFSQQLRKAEEQLRRRARHYLALPVEGGMRRLDSSLIYYLESEGHRVHFYTEEGDFVAAGTLKAFEEKLAERPFARCNSGYLVNLAQVKSVQQGMVQVGPYELQVSRPRRKAFLAALADHIGGEGA